MMVLKSGYEGMEIIYAEMDGTGAETVYYQHPKGTEVKTVKKPPVLHSIPQITKLDFGLNIFGKVDHVSLEIRAIDIEYNEPVIDLSVFVGVWGESASDPVEQLAFGITDETGCFTAKFPHREKVIIRARDKDGIYTSFATEYELNNLQKQFKHEISMVKDTLFQA